MLKRGDRVRITAGQYAGKTGTITGRDGELWVVMGDTTRTEKPFSDRVLQPISEEPPTRAADELDDITRPVVSTAGFTPAIAPGGHTTLHPQGVRFAPARHTSNGNGRTLTPPRLQDFGGEDFAPSGYTTLHPEGVHIAPTRYTDLHPPGTQGAIAILEQHAAELRKTALPNAWIKNHTRGGKTYPYLMFGANTGRAGRYLKSEELEPTRRAVEAGRALRAVEGAISYLRSVNSNCKSVNSNCNQ